MSLGRPKEYTREEIISIIQNLYKNWGDTKTSTIRKCKDMPCHQTITSRFESIKKLREAAGVEKYKYRSKESNEECMEILRDIERDKYFTKENFVRGEGAPIHRADMGLTELRKAAGCRTRYIDTYDKKKEIIDEVLNTRHEEFVSPDFIDKEISISSETCKRWFGSFKNLRRLCNLRVEYIQPERTPEMHDEKRYSNILKRFKKYNPILDYHVYSIECVDTEGRESIYVGFTKQPITRIKRHKRRSGHKQIATVTRIGSVESFEKKPRALEREREMFFEEAINNKERQMYGGR